MANETEKLIKARKRQFAGEVATSFIAAGTLGGVVGYTGEKALGEVRTLIGFKANQKIKKVTEDSTLSSEEKLEKIESIKKRNEVVKNVVSGIGRVGMFVGSYCVGNVLGQQIITKRREMNYDVAKIVNKNKSKESK